MAETIEAFIKKAREKGLDDPEIRRRLTEGGWSDSNIDAGLDDLMVPVPPPSGGHQEPSFHNHLSSNQPIAVVGNLSVRGFEYMVMFITLLASAFSIGMLAHTYINSVFSKASDTYSYGDANPIGTFAITLLIVSFPIFAYMFLRLKKAELADPALRKDPSRRKLTQFTQLITFLFGMGYIIYFIYALMTPDRSASYGGVDSSPSVVEQLLHTLVTLVIAGGIFVYYWREEHKEV